MLGTLQCIGSAMMNPTYIVPVLWNLKKDGWYSYFITKFDKYNEEKEQGVLKENKGGLRISEGFSEDVRVQKIYIELIHYYPSRHRSHINWLLQISGHKMSIQNCIFFRSHILHQLKKEYLYGLRSLNGVWFQQFPPKYTWRSTGWVSCVLFILRNYYMVCIINVSPSVCSGEGVTLILISCLWCLMKSFQLLLLFINACPEVVGAQC